MNRTLTRIKGISYHACNQYFRRTLAKSYSSLKFEKLQEGPELKDFINNGQNLSNIDLVKNVIPYVDEKDLLGHNKKIFFRTYGCQMNENDTEVVWSILKDHEYQKTDLEEEADIVLIMTCAIREGAETKIWNRLKHLVAMKRQRPKRHPLQIGILGCMAERLKTQLIEKEKSVDVVAGPDSYKDLPRLLATGKNGRSAVNVLLSLDETYADVVPVKLDQNSKTAFVSIMRGCDNMCTYCIVPFTRGKERSRPVKSILEEIKSLEKDGIKEITLLGQNVNSYRDLSTPDSEKIATILAPGFKTVYKTKLGGMRFAELLTDVAESVPEVRIRFTSPHPKDFPSDVLETIKKYPNICNYLHLPAQSGSSSVLERMRRGYSRESYIKLVAEVRTILPDVTLSSDFICGFCGETEEEFEETLSLMKLIKYDFAYLFPYSMREKTTAHRRYVDDVQPDIKLKRLTAMNTVFRDVASQLNSANIGKRQLILVEETSKRSKLDVAGRNDGNIKVIIPSVPIPSGEDSQSRREISPGDYVVVDVTHSSSQVLKGIPLYHTTLVDFYKRIQ